MTDGGSPPEAHSDDLTLLETTLDAVVATDLDAYSVAELLDRACRLQRLSARIDAARAATLAAGDSAAEAPGVLRQLGFRTASQVVAAETGAPSREVHSTARTGQWLDNFPLFATAAAEGVLTLRHLRELRSLDKPDRRDALVASQDELAAAARDHDFVEFTNRLTVWLINHTDAAELKEQVKKTSCTWNTNTDGSIDGRFHLDPLSAAAVGTALGDEMQRLFRQQSEGPGNAETPNRRRGQALVGLVVGGAEAPGSATTTPLVNLVIGRKVLENFLERYLDPDTPVLDIDRDDPDYRCERIDGTPIHPDLAFVATAVAEFERVVLDERSRMIDMSVKSRGFPAWMKRALLITARARCRTRGCDSVWPCFASPTRVCLRQLAHSTPDPAMFAEGKLGFAGRSTAKLLSGQQMEGEFGSAKLGVAATPRPRTGRGLNRQSRAAPHLNLENRIDPRAETRARGRHQPWPGHRLSPVRARRHRRNTRSHARPRWRVAGRS